jgi:hypothetical protein
VSVVNRNALRTFIEEHCAGVPERRAVKAVQKSPAKAKRFPMTNGAMNGVAVLKPARVRI